MRSGEEPESADARFARAFSTADAYRHRRDRGIAESADQLLTAHADLRELLEPMLEDEEVHPLEPTVGDAGSVAATPMAAQRRFAHFRILGSLGGGGMGDVCLALDEKLGRKVALKLIRPEAFWSADAKQRFQRETLAIGRLDHPGICRLYEAGEYDGWPFMALQLIEGETLAQQIERARAAGTDEDLASSSTAPTTRGTIASTVAMIEQVARALHYAHEQGLVHRDIKPGNIMIGGDGRPIVLDFGLVRDERDLSASLSSSRRGVGTPLYMAPEQIRGAGKIDARTDVYSLGVTLYECLTHVRPFDGATEAELSDRILANVYRDPCRQNRRLPPELGLVLACALDRDPDRRYRTALAMAEDLRAVIDLQPVQARAIGTALRMRRWVQRNPTLLAVSSLAVAALLGMAVAANKTIEAKGLEALATARADEVRTSLDLFRLLSDVVKLEDAKTGEQALYPALPEQVQLMRDWQRERGEPLAKRLPTLEAALVKLRKKARDQTPAEQQAERESHPLRAKLQQQRARLASMQLVVDVETGKAHVAEPELDAEVKADTAASLYRRACGAADPARTEWGKEAFGLACARLALAKCTAGDTSIAREEVLHALGWVCYANGLDDEAKQRFREAQEHAPANSTRSYAQQVQRIEELATMRRGARGTLRIDRQRARIAALEAEIALRREYVFADDGDRFLHETLSQLVDDLRVFCGPEGELSAVAQRLIEAESVRTKTIEDQWAEWDEAIAAIAQSDGETASKLYEHLALEPQIGLVPIGVDPESRLWEFAHLASGEIAARDPATDRLAIVPDTGIVFVLLPGGTFAMGTQKLDPKGTNYDPDARVSEGPVHDVTLSAFFLSKYEITRGQWQRLAGGEQPGSFKSVRSFGVAGVSLFHPVESVDWPMCDELMQRNALCIPTEAQWEYGCRAGTTTPWWTGDAPASVDTRRGENNGWKRLYLVGDFAPNAFGLYGMEGGVQEWCRDWIVDYRWPERPGDGLRPTPRTGERVLRGGFSGRPAEEARSARRHSDSPRARNRNFGLRPARVVQR